MKRLYSLLLAVAAMLPAAAQEGKVPTLYGNLIWDDTFYDTTDKRMGVYSFPAKAEGFEMTPLATSINFNATGNGIMDGRNYWFLMTDYWDGEYYTQLYRYDMETWERVGNPPDVDMDFNAADFAYDQQTKKVYGLCTSYAYNQELCEMDFPNKKRTSLAAIADSTYMTLAADAEGQLYAISKNGNLVMLDHEANPTFVCRLLDGQTTMSDRVQSATFDMETGIMYWVAQLWDKPKNGKLISGLYAVDVKKREMTKIVDLPYNAQIVALYVKQQVVASGAPAEPTDVGKDFSGGSLSGNITFTAPDKTADGAELKGEINYEVVVDETNVLAAGKAQPGTKVSAPVALAKEGTTRFVVRCSNAEGTGKEKAYTTYIGFDQTTAPEKVKTEFDADGNVKMTWEKPESTLNGGYCDMDALKYNVVCHRLGEDPQTVATGLTAREYSLTLPAETYVKYCYGVVAVNDTHESEEALGNDFAYGPAISVSEAEPYTEGFDTSDSFRFYTALDLNGDKKISDFSYMGFIFYYGFWGYSTKYDGTAIYYNADSGLTADDWLLTPMLNLKAGNKYNLEFQMWRDSENVTDKAEVAFGEGFDTASYKKVLDTFVPGTYDIETSTAPAAYKVQLAPEKDGRYMVGFHIVSEPYKGGNVYLDNVKLALDPTSGITAVEGNGKNTFDIYSASGILVRRNASSTDALPKGVYVVNGRKVVVE